MRALLAVAAIALLLAAAIAVEAPATLVDRKLDELTHGRLRVSDTAGTIWNGSGVLTLLPYNARVPVQWHIDALPLLRSRLSGMLDRDLKGTATEPAPATFDVSADEFAVKRLVIAFPAEALLRATDAPSLITAAGGTVDVRADAFAMLSGNGCEFTSWAREVLRPRADHRI